MPKSYGDYFPTYSRSSAGVDGQPAFLSSTGAHLAAVNYSDIPLSERVSILQRILEKKIHGLSFSPYLEGQAPGCEISEQQIRERLEIISPCCNWIRTFSCTDGNERSPVVAREFGLDTMVGVCLGEDHAMNETELASGIAIARAGNAGILAVGNEVLLRGDLSEDEILDYILRAREAVPGVPVAYVDAYFLFEKHPRVAEACDVILINCYPLWESCPAEYAPAYMREMYRRAQAVANGKKVIISETGWPSRGEAYGEAVPGKENAINYFIETCRWAEKEGVEIFYFSSFDESWKTGDEGDVGAWWGLWDQHGKLKYF